MAAQQWTPASLFPFAPFSPPNAPNGPAVPYDNFYLQQRLIPQQPTYFPFQPGPPRPSFSPPNDAAHFQAPARNQQLQPQQSIPQKPSYQLQPSRQISDFVAPEHDDPPIMPELPTLNLATLNALPCFLYISLLLFLPFFYRARVNQIFYGVSLTEKEITSRYVGGPHAGLWRPRYWEEVKRSWSDFIDSTIKEWNTLNIVSVLLLGAIYNVLQLGGSASGLVQCTALMSLVSALMSLIFGCLYVIRFETMRRPHKAMQWARTTLSARNSWWNVFILLALPFVWLAWSLILFVVCLMAVVWQTSGHTTSVRGLFSLSLETKITVSVFLSIGVLHLSLILYTFSGYDDIDKGWNKRFKELARKSMANRQYDDSSPWGPGAYLPPAAFPPPHVAQFAPPAASAQQRWPPELQPASQQPDRPLSTLDAPFTQSLPRQPPARLPTPPDLSRIDVEIENGSDTSPFIPSIPSPSASRTSHRGRYDNRYLSAHYTPPSQSSRRPHTFSIAEGQRQSSSSEPRRYSPHPAGGQGDPSSHTSTNSSSVQHTPGVFNLPENTIMIDAASPLQSSDNHSTLERNEMPIQYHPEPDGHSMTAATTVATSASLPPISVDIPVRLGVGAWGSISPGTRLFYSAPGSGLSSRRRTPSPSRNRREDPDIRTSERLRLFDLPSSSAVTRSISLPTTFDRRRGSRGPEFGPRAITASSEQVQPPVRDGRAPTPPQTTTPLPQVIFPQPHPYMLMSDTELLSDEFGMILQDHTGSAQPANPSPPDLSPLHISPLPHAHFASSPLYPSLTTPPGVPSPSYFREGAGEELHNTDPFILPRRSSPTPLLSVPHLSPIEEARESSSPETRRSSIRRAGGASLSRIGRIGRPTSEEKSQRRYSEYTSEASAPGDSPDISHRVPGSSNSPGAIRVPTPTIDPLLPVSSDGHSFDSRQMRFPARQGSQSDGPSTGPATSQVSLGLSILHSPRPRPPASVPSSDSVEFSSFGASTGVADPTAAIRVVPTPEGRGRSIRRSTPSLQRDRGRDRDGDGDRNSSIRISGIFQPLDLPSSAPEATTMPVSFAVDIPFGSGSNSTTTISTIASSTMATTGSHSPPRLEPVTETTENSPSPNGILQDDSSESTYVLTPLELDLVSPQLRGRDEPGVEIDVGGIVDSDSSSVMSGMSLHTAPASFESESLGEGEP